MKKQLIILLAALLPAVVMAQSTNFSLTGRIGGLNAPARVYFDYMDNGISHEDSAAMMNGYFKFTGNVSVYGNTRLTLDHDGVGKQRAIAAGDVLYFFFGKENIQLISGDSLANAAFSGSNIYDQYMAFNKVIGGTMMDLTRAANFDFAKGTPAQQKDTAYFHAVDARFRKNIKIREEKELQYAKDNPHTLFGLVALSESAGVKVDVPTIEPIFNAFDENLRNLDIGKELAYRINAAHILVAGKQAPEFTQNDANGNPISLASLKGKIVLIDFWASWCGPCRAGNPNLLKQYQLYKNKGFEILSISLDHVKNLWTAAIAKDGLTWPNLSDLNGWNNAVGRLYGIRSVPQSLLIDRNGKIIANDLKGEELNKKLAEIFNN